MGDDKKRKRWPFDEDDEFFGYFDDLLEDMRKRMEKLFTGFPKDIEMGKPFVWGYSFRLGPDGKPEFRQFGDTPAMKPWTGESRREPMTDVIEREDTISITVELPGVERNEIDLRTDPNRVTIKVDNPDRRYYKDVDMPKPIDPDSTKATFKNGVLDITVKKAPGERGKRVSIE